MPRGRRYIVPGHTYHVIHRCHNCAFLLQFKRDRSRYRTMLRERLTGGNISLFSYCITSNHVHLLLRPPAEDGLAALSCLMQRLEGDFAQEYNRRKSRRNAFWGDRYHATMIESGEHLWRCLMYIDLNMVRAGVVDHPRKWPWTGYSELMGIRQRYRVVDVPRLLKHLGSANVDEFRTTYDTALNERLRRHGLARESVWAESLAVGSEAYVKGVGRLIRGRMQVETFAEDEDTGQWVLRETKGPGAYS